MKSLIIIVSLIATVMALTIAFAQRRELASLKLEEHKLQQQVGTEPVVQPVVNVTITSPPPQHTPSAELLRLRGEVGQLERRKRELNSVHTENDKLRVQLVTKRTNTLGGLVLPTSYLKKTDAKFMGYSTPEDTIQSLLWAIQNRNTTHFLQAFNPEMAKQFETEIQRRDSSEEFFKEADAIPGLRIIEKKVRVDGAVLLNVEILPGDETHSEKMLLKQFDGQWKLLSGL